MRAELLSPQQMAQCDALTIQAGTPGTVLMERAGQAVADTAKSMLPANGRVVVLAGPGNNGGDGYVAARLLAAQGFSVQVFALGETGQLTGDAKWAFEGWQDNTASSTGFNEQTAVAADLLIDALFGSGLTRALDGEAARLVALANESGTQVLAVDLPSGLDGATGVPPGAVMGASQTITFHTLKPGHVLLPGRELCGLVHVADIGIANEAMKQAGITARLTGHYLAPQQVLSSMSHKYQRGHALVLAGGPTKAGAGFLAASAALRVGAGLVSIGAPRATVTASTGAYPALMRQACETPGDLASMLADPRITSCALGPGLPPNETTRQMVYAALASPAALVLDAGALSAFAGLSDQLFALIQQRQTPVVLTPHEGEFKNLFGKPDTASKIERTHQAATRSGAVVLYKGADTIIAAPDRSPHTCFVNANAPPWLATAGSGDVLTGIIAGLMASQRFARHTAASAVAFGAWLHGAAALKAGPGMVASDLEATLRSVLYEASVAAFDPLEAR